MRIALFKSRTHHPVLEETKEEEAKNAFCARVMAQAILFLDERKGRARAGARKREKVRDVCVCVPISFFRERGLKNVER